MESMSFSNTLSKGSVYESDSIFKAYQNDALSRLAADIPASISNEQIEKDQFILETYRVEDDPIHGGMGSVWRVHHMNWDTDLAMKRPQPRFFAEGSERRKEEFILECEHWIDLGLHPNIVSCYYVREIGGVPTIFSEWMDGGSLKDAIQSGRLYEGTETEVQARILDVAIQAARGLQYSHERGLIHQDVKPGNILLTRDWDAKVADFGLAKAQSQLTDGQKPASSGYTLAYCPREQAEGAAPERWMDVYAWAVTVAEMYVGGHPWPSGGSAAEHFADYLLQARKPVPEPVTVLLTRCLTKRMDSFGTIAEELSGIYRGTIGVEYPRPQYSVAGDRADNMNNYALSMLDLGKPEIALATWDEAIHRFLDHAPSIINRAFFLWHEAKITDGDVLDTFKMLPDSPELEDARETFALESGERSIAEDGTAATDLKIEGPHNVCDACFEGNERVWLARRDILGRFDVHTGQPLASVTREQAGQYLELAAATSDGAALYTGETDKLLRVDIDGDCALTPLELVPARQERMTRYPDSSIVIRGKRYIFKGLTSDVRWHSLWLEAGDQVLAVVEESRWRNPDDWAKFSFWCNYPHRRTSPVAPHVDERKLYHILRYRLEGQDRAVLSSIEPIEGHAVFNYKVQALTKPQDRWRSVVTYDSFDHPMTRLQDRLSGRFVRSSARIIAFSPDQKRYLFATGDNTIGSKHSLTVCLTPEHGAGNRLYALCHIRDVATLQREEAAAKACYAAFEQAMERRDYAAAIARFEEYRTLPDKQDAAETVAMERKLDSACRRVGLHHLAPPAVDTAGFDMTPLAQEWVCILNGNTYRLHEKGTGSIKNTPYEAPVTRAQELVKKKLPLAYRDDAGEKRTLEGDMVFTRMLSRDMKTAYVSVEKRGPGAKLGAVEVDLTTGKMKVAALNAHSLLPAPNGTTMVEWRHDGVMVFNGSLTGRLVPVDTRGKGSIDDMTILSDSRFALYHAANPHRYGIIPLFPENAAATDMSLPPEPELPAGSSSEGIRLTADGCHILRRLREEHKVQENGLTILKDRTQRDVPWLRLSWSFAPPEKTEIDRKTPASPAADAAQPPKGFLSRLFGKRG